MGKTETTQQASISVLHSVSKLPLLSFPLTSGTVEGEGLVWELGDKKKAAGVTQLPFSRPALRTAVYFSTGQGLSGCGAETPP